LGGRRSIKKKLHPIEHVDEGQGIDAGEIADDEHQHEAAQSQPASNSGRSHPSTIFNIAAFPLSFPAHTLTVVSIKGTEQMEPYPSVQCKPLARIIHDCSSW